MIKMKQFGKYDSEAEEFINQSIDGVQGAMKTVIVYLDDLDDLTVSKDVLNKAQEKDVNLGFFAPTLKLYITDMIEAPKATDDIDLSLERRYELGKYVVAFKDNAPLPFNVRITIFKEDDEQDGNGFFYSVKDPTIGYEQTTLNNDGIITFETTSKGTYTIENNGQRFDYESRDDETEIKEDISETDINEMLELEIDDGNENIINPVEEWDWMTRAAISMLVVALIAFIKVLISKRRR